LNVESGLEARHNFEILDIQLEMDREIHFLLVYRASTIHEEAVLQEDFLELNWESWVFWDLNVHIPDVLLGQRLFESWKGFFLFLIRSVGKFRRKWSVLPHLRQKSSFLD
jgi:hypothetical protein